MIWISLITIWHQLFNYSFLNFTKESISLDWPPGHSLRDINFMNNMVMAKALIKISQPIQTFKMESNLSETSRPPKIKGLSID